MINNQHVDLVHGSQGGINVSPCWSHPCSVQNATAASPCGLMGNCRPIMNDYSCECPLGKLAIESQYRRSLARFPPQIREQMLVPDLYVLTVESAAYEKRLKREKKNSKKKIKK